MTSAHWSAQQFETLSEAAAAARGAGLPGRVGETVVRLRRLRVERRGAVDALAVRRPGGAVERWARSRVKLAYVECSYRRATHSHSTVIAVRGTACAVSEAGQVRPGDVGLPRAYARRGYAVAVSSHEIDVTGSWIRDVKMRGAAVVGGLLTLSLSGDAIEGAIHTATWVEQGRGTALRQVSGWMVRHADGRWQHADTLAGARRVATSREPAAPREVRSLPTDPAALLRRAHLRGDEVVLRATAAEAGHCAAGVRDWTERHGLSHREEITARELAELACSSRDRLTDVYAVLLACARLVRRAA